MKTTSVAEIVWPWRNAEVRSATPDAPHVAKGRLCIEAAVGLTIGLILTFAFDKILIGRIVFTITGVIFLSGMLVPKAHAAIQRGFMVFAHWVGIALSWILLMPFFYICFGLGRVGLLIKRKDPLERAFESDASSYWVDRESRDKPEQYRHQY